MHAPLAIIGAGFSGSMLAQQLLRRFPETPIMLIERSSAFGPGVAYQSQRPEHLLNVPAGRMSAFPDEPQHFLDWLNSLPEEARDGVVPAPGAFVPRRLYGLYLRVLLEKAGQEAGGERLRRVTGDVVAVGRATDGVWLRLGDGTTLTVGTAIVATGNTAPGPTVVPEAFTDSPLYRPNPWCNDATEGLAPDAPVLLVGTGLTMADLVLELLSRGHAGPIHVLSRRGLLPRSHPDRPASPISPEGAPRTLGALLRFVRAECARMTEDGEAWQAVIDALRPITQSLWTGWSAAERRRFLAHVRPWWDVHRHRVAPVVAARIAEARNSGQLQVHRGRLVGCEEASDGAMMLWRAPGAAEPARLRVQRVFNCTGPDMDITRSPEPLTRALLRDGLARPDPLRLGFDMTEHGALVDATGHASGRLLGIGPVRRGQLWETTAVPDIRMQCVAMADWLAAR